jgi:hypothetical protein
LSICCSAVASNKFTLLQHLHSLPDQSLDLGHLWMKRSKTRWLGEDASGEQQFLDPLPVLAPLLYLVEVAAVGCRNDIAAAKVHHSHAIAWGILGGLCSLQSPLPLRQPEHRLCFWPSRHIVLSGTDFCVGLATFVWAWRRYAEVHWLRVPQHLQEGTD